MSIPAWINTANAEANFVVANTPNFLVRKYKEEPAARTLSSSLSGKELLDAYRDAVVLEPGNLRQQVTPYLILAAMYLKKAIPELRDAAAFQALPNYKWLATFRQILEDTFSPVTMSTFTANSYTSQPVISSAGISMFRIDGQ